MTLLCERLAPGRRRGSLTADDGRLHRQSRRITIRAKASRWIYFTGGHRSGQLPTAGRETDLTAGAAGERRGYPKMGGERYALHLLRTVPTRYDLNSDSILRPGYGGDQ